MGWEGGRVVRRGGGQACGGGRGGKGTGAVLASGTYSRLCSPRSCRPATPRGTTRSVAPASAATAPCSESCPSVSLALGPVGHLASPLSFRPRGVGSAVMPMLGGTRHLRQAELPCRGAPPPHALHPSRLLGSGNVGRSLTATTHHSKKSQSVAQSSLLPRGLTPPPRPIFVNKML